MAKNFLDFSNEEDKLPPIPMKLDYPANVSEESPEDFLPALEADPEAEAAAQYKLAPGNAHAVVTPGPHNSDMEELDAQLVKNDSNDKDRLDQEMSDADAMQSPFPEEGMPEQRMPAAVADQPIPKMSPQEQLLSTYQQYKNAQNKARDNNQNLGILGGFNKIAQGLATGYGAKIDANETGMKQLQDMNNQPVEDLAARIKMGGDEMNDPKSDISKFMREQAYAVLKKLNPEKDYSNKLDSMSAEQLQKLPGLKNLLGSAGIKKAVGFGQFIDAKTNHPLYMDQADNKVYDSITGQIAGPDTQIVRPIAYEDPRFGNRGYMTQSGMLTPGSGDIATTAEKPDVTQAQIAKAAPKISDELQKKQKDFINDMKDARETATSVTNLSSKLASGNTKGIDSGMLGSIQTQAAKMAGQKGVLTDQDLEKFGGAGGWVAAAKRATANAAEGKMTQQDIDYFKRFNELMGHSLATDIENRTQIHTRQTQGLLSSIAPGITEANVNKLLGADVVAPIVQDKSKSTSNMVRIKTPSGKLMDIPKDKLKDALKKGATEVK